MPSVVGPNVSLKPSPLGVKAFGILITILQPSICKTRLSFWTYSHPFVSTTLINLYVKTPEILVGTFIETVSPKAVVIDLVTPPFIWYVNVYGAIPFSPLKTILGAIESIQIKDSPEILVLRAGLTVKTKVARLSHPTELFKWAL